MWGGAPLSLPVPTGALHDLQLVLLLTNLHDDNHESSHVAKESWKPSVRVRDQHQHQQPSQVHVHVLMLHMHTMPSVQHFPPAMTITGTSVGAAVGTCCAALRATLRPAVTTSATSTGQALPWRVKTPGCLPWCPWTCTPYGACRLPPWPCVPRALWSLGCGCP